MVEQFVNECLGGDWSRLEDVNPKGDYDPHDPLAGSWWLKCPGKTFDCDDCELSRAVYRDVWGLGAPDYRGDTMNSFRTLLGHERFTTHVTDVSRAFDGTEAPRWFDLPEEVKNRVRDYYWTYHTIGNFLPLPDAEVDGTTLNRWRGTCAWHDYFCPFLAGQALAGRARRGAVACEIRPADGGQRIFLGKVSRPVR